MAVQPGKRYYFIAHAYHHFLAEVVEITGKREADVIDVRRIQSCRRPWTDFFRDGCKDDTDFTVWPDCSLTWFVAVDWPHEIPGATHAAARRR